MDNKTISVISTYASDRLIDGRTGKITKEQKGGPVLYIVQALESLGLEPKVYTGEEMLVEILVKDDDEFGKIHEPETKSQLPQLETASAIVSTLLDEWDLTNARDYMGKLFVDIQGYVRDGSAFGKKKAWFEIKDLAPAIFCLKGNEVEIETLPPEVIADQKENRMLIVTKDSSGVEVYYKGQSYIASPQEILHPPHTIGAGDTLFANFVAKFMETEDIKQSTDFALAQTSKFLKDIKG